MEDILITDIQEFEKITDSEVIEKEVPESLEDIKEGKEIEEFERESIDKSDIIILDSNDFNSLRSAQTVSLDDLNQIFDRTVIYRNANVNGNIQNNLIQTFSEDADNFDYLLFEFTSSESTGNLNHIIMSVADFKRLSDRQSAMVTFSYYSGNSGASRLFRTLWNDDSRGFHLTASSGGGGTVTSYNFGNVNYVEGLKIKTLSNNETPSPSVSGNTINNYYITVSGNGVSYNLIDKPLSEYTPTESMFALSILFALGIGFVILMRKVVFRWK